MSAFHRLTLAIGVVAVLVGSVGAVVPVSVSPVRTIVGCGTAVSPRLPATSGDTVNPDYSRLCQMEIVDRRQWTLTLLGAGVLLIVVSGIATARRSRV